MIKINKKAVEKLKEIRNSENYSSDYNVRVKVKGGGCSGLMYDLNFDNKISDDDNFFEDNNIKIMVGLAKSAPIGVDTKEDLAKVRQEMKLL